MPQFDDAGRVIGLFGVARDVTERKWLEQKLHESEGRFRRLVEAQEEERRRIARDLHDEVGQALTGIKFLLETGTCELSEKARSLIQDLIAHIRDLSLDLRPPMLDDLGLLHALLWHFDRYTAQTGVRVTFRHTGLQGRRFAPEVETGVYRVAQEALTNVARHAGVSEATVQIRADGRALHLLVEDCGVGFDPDAALTARASSGLSGMRERAALLGGQLTVASAPEGGTLVTAELPIDAPVEGKDEEQRSRGAEEHGV